MEGSWPAGHCRHAHPFPHRDCTAAVPPQPNSWKTQKHTRESEEVRTRVDTLLFLHNRAHKACAYLPREGQELSSKGGSSSSSTYSSMYIWSKERTGEGLIIKHDQFTRIYEILNAVYKNKKKGAGTFPSPIWKNTTHQNWRPYSTFHYVTHRAGMHTHTKPREFTRRENTWVTYPEQKRGSCDREVRSRCESCKYHLTWIMSSLCTAGYKPRIFCCYFWAVGTHVHTFSTD